MDTYIQTIQSFLHEVWMFVIFSVLLPLSMFLWNIRYRRLDFSAKNISNKGQQWLAAVKMFRTFDTKRIPMELTRLSTHYKGVMHLIPSLMSVNDAATAKEAYVKLDPSFANRFSGCMYVIELASGEGILGSDNDEGLMLMRKAAFQALHKPGTGLDTLDRLLQEEMESLSEEIISKEGSDVAPTDMIYGAIISIMTTILFGERNSYDSEEVRLIYEYDRRVTSLVTYWSAPEVNTFPWLLELPFDRYKNRKQDIVEFLRVKKALREKLFQKHKALYNPDDIRCVLSSLMKSQELEGKDVFTDEMVDSVMSDFVTAGSITSSNSLSGLIFILANKPEIQERMYREIKEVVGDGRMPRTEDKDKLPYVQAVILEAIRYQSVLAINPRVAAKDTELAGHFVPKNTIVFINHWGIHHDAANWKKPNEFYPEHFLNKQGQLLLLDEYQTRGFFPFGTGRRRCIGEAFARGRLFLMSAALVQRFNISPPTSGQLPQLRPDAFQYSIITEPPHYQVRFSRR